MPIMMSINSGASVVNSLFFVKFVSNFYIFIIESRL